MTPPTTPIGRDELALKRHRFFSDLLEAAHAAVEHRVRFDPMGPIVPEVVEPEEPGNKFNLLYQIKHVFFIFLQFLKWENDDSIYIYQIFFALSVTNFIAFSSVYLLCRRTTFDDGTRRLGDKCYL